MKCAEYLNLVKDIETNYEKNSEHVSYSTIIVWHYYLMPC